MRRRDLLKSGLLAGSMLPVAVADPDVTLRRAGEAGIDKTVIFTIEDPTYERANESIARLITDAMAWTLQGGSPFP